MELYFKWPSPVTLKKLSVYLLFLINLIVIFWLWASGSNYYIGNPSSPGNTYIAFGRITGLLGEYFLLIQLILIGRIRWFEHLFGFDRLNKVHRWIGFSILLLLIAHPLLLILGNSVANGVSFYSQFGDYLANKEYVLLAFIALAIFIYIIFLSISIVRKKLRYETWYLTHLLTYLAIGLALAHQFGTGDLREGRSLYYWYILNFSIFGIVLLYRFSRPLMLFAIHRFIIQSIIPESHNSWSVYITGKHMKSFKFKPGQYANLNILSRGMWSSHPFSFSDEFNGEYIRFTIKNSGDFTSKISSINPGTHVIIDGPLGIFVSSMAIRDKYLLIAGGIGITPLLAILKPLVKTGKDVVLLYSAKTEQDLVLKNELDEIQNQAPNFSVDYVLSTPTEGYDFGRIDKEKIIRLVPDFYSREVFLCGPSVMMEATDKNLKEIGFPDAHVHYEKFSF